MANSKRRHLLWAGGAAAGIYLLSRTKSGSSASGLGIWPFTSEKEKAENLRDKATALYNEYRKLVTGLPAEYAKANAQKFADFKEILARVYNDQIKAGYTALEIGDTAKAQVYFTYAVNEIPQRIQSIKEFMVSAPKALEALKAGASQAQVELLASAAARERLAEEMKKAKTTGKILDVIDKPLSAAEEALLAAGDPLGIKGGKGFFENMQDFLARMKWYAVAGVGIYAAVKFGPSIIAWAKARSASKQAAPAANPPRHKRCAHCKKHSRTLRPRSGLRFAMGQKTPMYCPRCWRQLAHEMEA